MGDSWMGGCHGYLPWQAHVEITMGIPWNCIETPGWVDAMDIFHGKLMWRSPWASHGIALGLLDGWTPWISSMASSCGDHHGHPMELHWDSWMGGRHGYLPWQAHVEITMGIPMELHWDSWMGGRHGYLPLQAHVEITMGIPMELHWDSWMGGCHGYLPWQA